MVEENSWWAPPVASGPICAKVSVPGSKSQTNRALVLASLADGQSVLSGVLDCRDTQLMIAGLQTLGVNIESVGQDEVRVSGCKHFVGGKIDCGLAGTVMRFLPPVALLAQTPTSFFGDNQASLRPMGALTGGLRQLGAQVSADRLPFSLTPPKFWSKQVKIDASQSSQFISGLLLSAARFPTGIQLTHCGEKLPSAPHILMTVEMLSRRGVTVDKPSETCWQVEPGTILGLDERIEPDLTTAAMFLAAGVLTEGQVCVLGWPHSTTQPGDDFRQILTQFGAKVELNSLGLNVSASSRLHGIDLDLGRASELVPVVAGMAAFSSGTTRIRGVGHIRGHETNRIAALIEMLSAVGVQVTEHCDGLDIVGSENFTPAKVKSYADHRMVHTAALLGLKIPGLLIDDVECTSKTLPDFPSRWLQLVGGEND